MKRGIVAALAMSIIGLAVAGSVAGPAEAQDLCVGLKHAVAQAAQNFESLKTGPGRSEREGMLVEYPAGRQFPSGGDCKIEERFGGRLFRYYCDLSKLGELPRAKVIAQFKTTAQRIRRCFPDIKPDERGDPDNRNSITASLKWTLSPEVEMDVRLIKASGPDIGSIDVVTVRVSKSARIKR